MILVVTNECDITTDFIVIELEKRSLPFFRLNTEKLPQARVTFNPSLGETGWLINFDDEIGLDLSLVTSAYFRRPGSPVVSDYLNDESAMRYCKVEWDAMLSSALNSLGDRWLNSPLAILAAENKPKQMSLALTLGFSLPETLLTNDSEKAIEFVSKRGAIAKPIREALVKNDDEERVIFTSRVNEAELLDLDSRCLASSPVIFQEEIIKKSDVRVTVVGNKLFAVEIFSQEFDDSKVDWRMGENPNIAHKEIELPVEIHEKCIAITSSLNLIYGAIDLVIDCEDKYWFLEINPNGQWAWIEHRTGLPISKSIVDELERISLC